MNRLTRKQAEQIGERLYARRLELGLSQRDLGEPGICAAYISRIEKGDRIPSLRALRRLASKLNVSAYWLETGQPDPSLLLAQMVLDRRNGDTLPAQARRLAQQILQRQDGLADSAAR